MVNQQATFPPLLVCVIRIDRSATTIECVAGHYVENTGNTTLRYLEIFKTGTRFACVPDEYDC